MSRYEKISGGSGFHGEKYEINLLLYYLMNAYEAEDDFQLSNGNKDKLKLDDIVIETDSYKVYAQAKHIDNEKKKMNRSQMFAETGKFSLCVYLKVAFHDIFIKLLQDIQQQLEDMIQDGNDDTVITSHLNSLSSIINNSYENSYDMFMSDLRDLKNPNINDLLESFQKTSFHLITNVFPNEELETFCVSDAEPLDNFDELDTFYNFNTDKSNEELSKLFKNSKIPTAFIELFLEKFFLIVITDDALEASINKSLKTLSLSLQIPLDVICTNMFELIEKWRSERVGVYLTRSEVDAAYFSYILNKMFKKQLKDKANLLEINIDSLLSSTNNSFITIVRTPRSHVIMSQLQKTFESDKNEQSLFINPYSDKQNFVTKAFLHRKYTHLVCILQKDNEELSQLINDIVLQVESNEAFKKYKKFILFCDKDVPLGMLQHRNVIEDNEWFDERILSLKRFPNSLGDEESYYIQRALTQIHHEFHENDFLKHVIHNRTHFFIISDSPGMGKTSILSSLAVKVNTENYYWAVIIELNQYTKLLESHMKSKTIPQLNEFLDKQIRDPFERQMCEIPNMLILMVDAFDEISPQYSDIVTEFLKSARTQKNVKAIVVTTRTHLKHYLEMHFEVGAFGLKPFTTEDVYSMISKFRKKNLNGVKEWYSSNPRNVVEFLNVPLHTRMFAELYDEFHTNLSPKGMKIHLYELYEAFVNKKREIFIEEKCRCRGNIHTTKRSNEDFDKFLQFCTQFSIETTFRRDSLAKIGFTNSIDKSSKEEICANGILEASHTSLRFVHLSFMEYFLAKWIVEKFLDNNRRDRDIFYVIFDEIILNHFVCKQFLEGYLEKNWDLISSETLEIFGNIATNYDKPILRCFLYQYPFITRLFIEKCHNITLMDTVFKDIICSGLQHIQIDIISLLVDKVLTVDFKNSEGRNLLHFASKKGSLTLVDMLVNKNKFDINMPDDTGLTPLFLAVLHNRFEISDYLITHGAGISDLCIPTEEQYKNYSRSFPNHLMKIISEYKSDIYRGKYRLHLAAFRGEFDLVKDLLNKGYDAREKTNDGWNALHCAARSGKFDVVKYLVSRNVNVNDLTDYGENVIHLAVQSSNLGLVKYLIDLNVQIDAKLKNEQTPLTIAINCKEVMILDYILETYSKLKNIHISAVLEALFFIVNNDYDNDLFKSIHKNHKGKFLQVSEHDFLFEAMLNNNTILMKYILTKNMYDRNLRTDNNMNYLHRAALIGHLGVMKALINNSKLAKGEKSADGKTELHYAVESKNLDLVRHLIDLKLDIHEKSLRGESLLHIAAGKGDLNMVKYFVELQLNVKEKTLNEETVFHYAVRTGSLALVKYLISLHVSPHDKDLRGWNAVHHAAYRGHLTIVRYLNELHVELFDKTLKGETVLHLAALSGNKELVNYFISSRIPLDEKNAKHDTVLHYASSKGHLNLMKHLINILTLQKNEVMLRQKNLDGETVLHQAARSGNMVLVEHLISLQLPPHEKTSNEETIIHFAALSGKLNLVEYLIELGMNITDKTSENKTVLHYAAESGSKTLVAFLIKCNLEIEEKTKNGENVLHFATQSGNLDLFQFLHSLNVRKDEKTLQGQTVLHYAAKSGSLEILKYLMKFHPNVHEKTLYKENLLHYAVQSKNFEVVKYLVGLNINIHEKTVNGKTVLHYAAEKGSLEIMNYLICLNVKVDEVTLNGTTVLDFAKEGENLMVVKYLQSLCT